MLKIKKFVATALACAMVFAMSATAFAAENEVAVGESVSDSIADSDAVSPRTTKIIAVSNGYVNMTGNDLRAPHGNGWFYYQVSSGGYDGWSYKINCLMYDSNGNVVWRGDDICGVAANGKLEYGGNVVRIDLQIAPRTILTSVKTFNVTVTY